MRKPVNIDNRTMRRVILDGMKIIDGYRIGLRLALLDKHPEGNEPVRRELEAVNAWLKRARATALELRK